MPFEKITNAADFRMGQHIGAAAGTRAGALNPPQTGLTGVDGSKDVSRTAKKASDNDQRDGTRKPYGGVFKNGATERTGFRLTSDLWIQEGKMLVLHAGPSEAAWTLPLRASDEETQSGHARYAQARRSGAAEGSGVYVDTPSVQLTFQTGNIIPLTGPSPQKKMVPYGLDDFYAFISLINQPPLIPSGKHEGSHNYTWIFYTSLMYPAMVLKGYFLPEGLSWSDSADNPAGFSWSAQFQTHESPLNIWEYDALVSAYQTFDFF